MRSRRTSLLSGWQSFVLYAFTALTLFGPTQSVADVAKTQLLSQEIAQLLSNKNDTTTVEINECTLRIVTRVRTTCSYPSEPNWSHTTLKLSEIRSFKVKPFRKRVVLSVEIDVPLPTKLDTLTNRLLKSEQEAFETYLEESNRLLEESDIASNRTLTSCTGGSYVRKGRSMKLFLDAEPQTINHLNALIARCQK